MGMGVGTVCGHQERPGTRVSFLLLLEVCDVFLSQVRWSIAPLYRLAARQRHILQERNDMALFLSLIHQYVLVSMAKPMKVYGARRLKRPIRHLRVCLN
jgi:hypothetical protein